MGDYRGSCCFTMSGVRLGRLPLLLAGRAFRADLHVMELVPPLEPLAQSAATIQVTEHGFGHQVDCFAVLGPLQLLLASTQVLQQIFEPEQFRFALAHWTPYLSQNGPRRTAGTFAMYVPSREKIDVIQQVTHPQELKPIWTLGRNAGPKELRCNSCRWLAKSCNKAQDPEAKTCPAVRLSRATYVLGGPEKALKGLTRGKVRRCGNSSKFASFPRFSLT